MSVEPTTLERSALERKARDELTTIAAHLGVKTKSRDRKADIVQAILDETGSKSPEGARAGEPRGSNGANGGAASSPSDPNRPTEVPEHRDQGDAPVSQDNNEDSIADARPPNADATDPAPAQLSLDASAEAGGGSTTDQDKVVKMTNPESETSGAAEPKPNGATDHAAGPAETAPKTDGHKAEGQAESTKQAEGQQQDQQPQPAEGQQQDQPSQQQGQQKQGQQGQGQKGRQREQRNGQRGGQGQGGSQGGGQGQGGSQGQDDGNRRRRRRGRNRGGEGGGGAAPEEYTGEPIEVDGYLDLRDEGYGFLRVKGSRPSKDDIYVSVKQARQFGLRKGDHIKGGSRPALRNEKNPALLRIDEVNDNDPEKARERRKFGDLTPLFPDEKLSLETPEDASNMTARIIDLISPIGKGQRGLIVSPPKAGKTTIIKQIVRSIEINNPEVKLLVLQVDERPEEVTDMRRWLRNPESEVLASTFDRPADEHAHVAELAIERAKRMVEDGHDVCVILDGITRLARAYNLAAPATGRIMSGGVDSGALYPPKKFFGAARNVEEGGSLTILATALIETGSKMDEVIFEEFKGTGNMELRLDRRLSERRIYPAIDVDASSTRHEELLFPRNQLNLVWALRRVLSGLSSTDGGNAAALELLTDRMKTFRSNEEFLAEVAKNRLAAG